MNDYASQIKASTVWNQEFEDWDDILERGIIPTSSISTVDKIALLIMRTGQQLQQEWSRGLSEFQLSIPQMNVLEALYFTKKSAMSQAELSQKVFTSKANMSSLLGRMETLGYISKQEDKENRRNNTISITEKGEEKVKEVFTYLYSRSCPTTLQKEEQETLLQLLLRFKRGDAS